MDPVSAYIANQFHDAIAASDSKHVHIGASRGGYVESIKLEVTGKGEKVIVHLSLTQQEAMVLSNLLRTAVKFAQSKAVS